ncbi:MAG: hypothetical protein KME07_12425 [Pegethrix bostrychoides GSE-TBD4-15B]|jgi:hypothetical protein|uniref:Uncharacterized protein n=1 Tax=Pegethrix bostrychoides GSE-TBD4-15B TaxID=2839662 RepID=A0A951PBN5_9CYAN|nr:hypothetical protein [Pegethrix bostrychoides GSE-TBD4-15B]
MGKYDSIGQLMHLPLENIDTLDSVYESEFVVDAAAESILSTDGRNWIPLIVKETGDYQYQVVANHFIYAVVSQANLERVWCIIIESDEKLIEQAKILAREIDPKINLATASGDSILSALRYLEAQPGSVLKGVNVTVAANRIEEAKRSKWSDLTPITKLKCGITKGKKLDALSKVFFIAAPPPPPPAPEAVSLKKASEAQIFERLNYLSTYSIGDLDHLDLSELAQLFFITDKSKWKSLNPLTKMDCGIDAAKLKVLKMVFTL